MENSIVPRIVKMKGGLIVSVQEDVDSPLNRPEIITALAQAVAIPGVVGLRLNEPRNIASVRSQIDLPIIGIYKIYDASGRVWITPTLEKARLLVEAGADIVAFDATDRPRVPGESVREMIAYIHDVLGVTAMADISNFQEGEVAARAGADIVATTLSGYTCLPVSSSWDPPDILLVSKLASALPVPIIAEGRFNTPELARQAIQAGAHAVVVGSAITRPDLIARLFTSALGIGSKT